MVLAGGNSPLSALEAKRLRGLVRALVRDEHAAEDVLQDARLLALRKAPSAGWEPVAWLRGVVRNVWRETVRATRRRERRERVAARRESVPPASAAVERLDTLAAVTRAIRELPEPYRTCVVLRHLEGRSVGEIARLLEVPVNTVKTRLRRGLALVRERLDEREGGDRGAWMAALLPLAAKGSGTGGAVAAAAWGCIVAMKLKILVGTIVLTSR